MQLNTNTKFIKVELLGSIALLMAVVLAMIMENSPFQSYYEAFINYSIGICVGNFHLQKPLLFWVNDGLICFFFLLIGLEIKRELFIGELSSRNKLILPCSAAITGVIFPAIIFTYFNYQHSINMRGWAIPTAMDTAFALGILALFGSSIPRSLRSFLISLAIIDDILAVLVIALFYANEISHLAAIASISICSMLVILNQMGVKRIFPYVVLGLILWILVLQSGVHTSIAGVILAFVIPLKKEELASNPLSKIEQTLHPWVSFAIIPLFAFVNAGIPLNVFTWGKLYNPLSLGIIFGLFIGKQVGVFGITWLLVKSKKTSLPREANWLHMYCISLLCGIGFTMSLFIGSLSFENGGPDYNETVKAAIYVGSFLSAAFSAFVFLIIKLREKYSP